MLTNGASTLCPQIGDVAVAKLWRNAAAHDIGGELDGERTQAPHRYARAKAPGPQVYPDPSANSSMFSDFSHILNTGIPYDSALRGWLRASATMAAQWRNERSSVIEESTRYTTESDKRYSLFTFSATGVELSQSRIAQASTRADIAIKP